RRVKTDSGHVLQRGLNSPRGHDFDPVIAQRVGDQLEHSPIIVNRQNDWHDAFSTSETSRLPRQDCIATARRASRNLLSVVLDYGHNSTHTTTHTAFPPPRSNDT